MTARPTESPITSKGYQLTMEAPNALSLIFLVRQRQVSVKPNPDNSAPPQHDAVWFGHSQCAVWFPASVHDIQGAVSHWCSYYDQELAQHVGAMLEVLKDLPQRTPDVPAPPRPGETLN